MGWEAGVHSLRRLLAHVPSYRVGGQTFRSGSGGDPVSQWDVKVFRVCLTCRREDIAASYCWDSGERPGQSLRDAPQCPQPRV